MPTLAADAYFTAFQQRQACCRALLQLSQRQSASIAADDYPSLLEILESKQSLLDHLDRSAGEFATVRQTWPRERDELAAADRQRCEALLVETESLLNALLAEERVASQLLCDRKQNTERELRSLAGGVQTHSAYQSRPHADRPRIDLNW
jgi:hypothetical protein